MTPDVNVLVAASRSDHPDHREARRWLDQALKATARGQRFALLPMILPGFLRIVTHPRVFVEPTPPSDAIAFIRVVINAPAVEVLEIGFEWPRLLDLCSEHLLSGNDVPDAWIAAVVLARHEHLVTFDTGFKRFLGPNQLTLLPST